MYTLFMQHILNIDADAYVTFHMLTLEKINNKIFDTRGVSYILGIGLYTDIELVNFWPWSL